MTTDPQVDRFMAELEHPLHTELLRVRAIVLGADERMRESIKWGAPTFSYKGDLATLTVRTKRFAHLYFQRGALLADAHPLLEGDAAQVRSARFYDLADVEAKADRLRAVVRAWIALREADA